MRISINSGETYEISDECMEDIFAKIKESLGKMPPELSEIIDMVNGPDDIPFLVEALVAYGLKAYRNLPMPKRLMAMQAVRGGIGWLEKKVGDPEFISQIRPPKKADPVEHSVSFILPVVENVTSHLREMLDHATVKTTTDGKNVTSIEFENTYTRR